MRLRFSIYLLLACSLAVSAAGQPTTPPATQPVDPSAPPAPAAPAAPAPARPAAPPTPAPGAAPQPAPTQAPGAAQPAPTPAPSEPAPEEPAPTELAPAPEPLPPVAEPTPAAPPPPVVAPSSDIPTPEEMEQKLSEGLGTAPQASGDWTAPAPVFTLHGYLRMRGELMDTFWLGRRDLAELSQDVDVPEEFRDRAGQGADPFSRFRPIERRLVPGTTRGPSGLDCVDEDTQSDGTCDVSTLQFANMRLRLSPQLNLSEDVRVKMTFDVFDNLVAGTPPSSFYGFGPAVQTVFASTDSPPSTSNGLGDSIKARRAWAEVRNRDLGELRFGRMPQHWGLGMYYNAGDGIDEDLSSDLDRVLGITKIAGLYLSASYDFIAEGVALANDNRPLDQSQLDDVDQFTFSVARRHTDEELSSDLERGEVVLNGGVQLSIRSQDSAFSAPVPMDLLPLVELQATTYTTDLWALFRYRGLRLEAEIAWVTGGMDNLGFMQVMNENGDSVEKLVTTPGSSDIDQLGYALEVELRLLDDKLAIYLDHGLATGDSDVESLSSDANFISQLGTAHDDTISTFRFHPSYRVDLILWRNIMRQVTGAYYIRPGISYDFIRNDFGQLLGARADFIWSRATAPVQTWGNDPDLGIEIDVSLYFRTEDGPDLDDGYHALLQYGVLFPMRGLGLWHEDTDLETAQTLRLLLGVVY
jgi:uncharacterized protein (TIGR04551 family)